MDKLLRIVEAAELLGITRSALYDWIHQGRIRPVKLPTGKYRITLSEIQRVMEQANPHETFHFTQPWNDKHQKVEKGHRMDSKTKMP